jgi:nucleoside-diphosphate-sugar epimerase
MEVLIAGGHGKIALHLERMLAARGDRARGLIRNPDHAAELERAGAEPVLCDLENDDPRPHIGAADAIVFAAGAGPGSGEERKWTVDYGGAVKLIEAAQHEGIRRYAIVSSTGADDPGAAGATGAFAVYLQAKHDADEKLRESGLDYTIVRPGMLTDDAGTGKVSIAQHLDRSEIPRDDVAAVLFAVLAADNTIGKDFDLTAGDTAIEDAVASV